MTETGPERPAEQHGGAGPAPEPAYGSASPWGPPTEHYDPAGSPSAGYGPTGYAPTAPPEVAFYSPIPQSFGPPPATGYLPVDRPSPPTAFLAQVPLRQDYATWWKRVVAMVIDLIPTYIGLAVFYAGYIPLMTTLGRGSSDLGPALAPVVIGLVITLAGYGWTVYNRYFLAGRTGQSVGRRVMKIWLVGRETGRPIGALNAFLRDLVHMVDGVLYVGYLWPLWDAERQTFSDKIMQTVVVTTATAPRDPAPRAS